jgi:hypothetical protein
MIVTKKRRAAPENWAARNKLEKQIKTVNTEPGGKQRRRKQISALIKPQSQTNRFPPERVQSPLDESDLSRFGHTKRFSDLKYTVRRV